MTDFFNIRILRLFQSAFPVTFFLAASFAQSSELANEVFLLTPANTAIELLKGREIGETITIDSLGNLTLNDWEAIEDAFRPTVSVTVLADSGLPGLYFEELAGEAERLKSLPVRILFKGLPMAKLPDGHLAADRPEIAKRLSPLLKAGVPSAVDPASFREVSRALEAFEEKTPKTPFTAPSVLVTVDGPDSAEPRHELVLGTFSPVKALQEVALHSPSRLMRRYLREALKELDLAHVIDLSEADAPDFRPTKSSDTSGTNKR